MAVYDEGCLAGIIQFTDPEPECSFSVSYALSSENIWNNRLSFDVLHMVIMIGPGICTYNFEVEDYC